MKLKNTIIYLVMIALIATIANALENNETFTQTSYYTNSTSLQGANHIAGNSTNIFITGYNGNSITELEVIGGTLTQKSYYANASSIGGANGVCTNGQGIIFITGFIGGTLTTFNSTSGTLKQTNVYTNATSITNPYDCEINGNYLYVSDYGSSGIVSFDITNPNNPIQIDYQVDETILTAINSLFIMNNTLYATAESGSSTTSIWNITSGTPSLLNWSVGVANPYRLTGNYGELLFVGSYTNQVDGTIQVYNVSNKKLELINPTYTNSTTFASLRGLANIQNYLFAIGAGSNTTTLLRINNGGTLTQIKYLQNDTSTYFPNDIIASGLRAFVVGYSGNSVAMFEITNSTTPPSPPTNPTIYSLTTNNATILNGTSTQINWITGNATNLDLSSINVSGLTAYNVSPTINTTYTLTATNENGSVNANLTINVYYPPPCIPSYYCSQTGTCNASNTIPCLNVSDLNTCGIPYNPLNYSDYNQACNYTTPTGYVASYEASDAPKALFDFVVAIFVGMAGVAVLIGLGIALGIFTKSDTGKNLLKNLKK